MQEKVLSMDEAIRETTIGTGKYLTFILAGEIYGMGILKVKEIVCMMPISPIPETPEFVKGVINLRGRIIPVVDLRLKFDLEPVPYTDRTCIIITEIDARASTVLMGLVVDSVSEVANIAKKQVDAAPVSGFGGDTDYILGMAKTDDGLKILLNIDRVLDFEDLDSLGLE